MFNEAIKETRHINSQSFLIKVMKKVLAHNPEWVIKDSNKRAMEIIDSGRAKDYSIAVNWLKWIKKGYLQKKEFRRME